MNMVIINGSVRRENTTMAVTRELNTLARESGWEAEIVTLEPFMGMFDGAYMTLENANPDQRRVLDTLVRAEFLVFVVPTYYKSMPGALKNFFDVVRVAGIFDRKRLGVVASNHKNQDYGARHAEEVLKGLLIFFNVPGFVVPEILILHPGQIDHAEARRWVGRLEEYPSFK